MKGRAKSSQNIKPEDAPTNQGQSQEHKKREEENLENNTQVLEEQKAEPTESRDEDQIAVGSSKMNLKMAPLQIGNWSKREDKLLKKAVRKYHHLGFSRISQELEGRSKNECKVRYLEMKEKREEQKKSILNESCNSNQDEQSKNLKK